MNVGNSGGVQAHRMGGGMGVVHGQGSGGGDGDVFAFFTRRQFVVSRYGDNVDWGIRSCFRFYDNPRISTGKVVIS